ncbi:S-adenosyl-L-methionine-dependent methyltransferase, partial [Rhodocollybia butyracea]
MSTSSDLKSIVEQGYNAIASKYDAWASPRPTLKRMSYIEKLAKSLPEGGKVLELGCGAGRPATQMLVGLGFDVLGVDISFAQISLAKQYVPSAQFMQSDMMALNFKPGSFDAVMGFYSLFHLPRDEQGPMVKKMIGWLRPGGWLLFNLHVGEGDVMRDDWMGAKMFSTGLGIEGNDKMLEEYGAELTDVESVVDTEYVGRFEEKFHWVCARKIF